MAPPDVTDDYYLILKIEQTASEIEIKRSYRRLAVLRHPDKNQNEPGATAAFQLLSRAYETLRDPTSRRVYDIRWPQIRKTCRNTQENAKRYTDAAKAAKERSAHENATREAEERISKYMIDQLRKKRQNLESEIFEVNRLVKRLSLELRGIEILEEKAIAEQNAKNNIWAKIFGAAPESDDQKRERELQRLQRQAGKTIKEKELSRKEEKLKEWTDLLSGVEKALAAEMAKAKEREVQAEIEREEARKREEAKANQKAYEEWQKERQQEAERERVRQKEAAARAAKERAVRLASEERRREEQKKKREQEVKEAEERRRMLGLFWRKQEEERQRQEREAEELRKKELKERKRKEAKAQAELNKIDPETLAFMYGKLGLSPPSPAKPRARATRTASASARASTSSPSASSSCSHTGWWSKIEDEGLVCEKCAVRCRKFILECPGCQMRACAECRPVLQRRSTGRAS